MVPMPSSASPSSSSSCAHFDFASSSAWYGSDGGDNGDNGDDDDNESATDRSVQPTRSRPAILNPDAVAVAVASHHSLAPSRSHLTRALTSRRVSHRWRQPPPMRR